jgi:hypothetical protein
VTRIIADENLHRRLSEVDGTVEIWTKDGEILGVFSPRAPELTPEELAEAKRGPWLTTQEVIDRLKRAGASE